jgi:carbonic anhydrase
VSPGLPAQPSRRLAIVTCMDCRIDPLAGFGVALGEAHVLRNAGGAVTDDVIRSLAISQRKLGTREVMVVRHTGCGMAGLDADAFTAELTADAGVAPGFAIEAFGDLDEAVRQGVARVRASPFVPYRDAVSGWVYEIEADRLRAVEPS